MTAEPAVALTPRIAPLTLKQSQQFTTPAGVQVNWSVDGIAGGNTTVGTISSSGLYVPPQTAGVHTVSAASVDNPGNTASAVAAVTDLSGIYTFHNDLARTGQNLQEYALTPANVSGGQFGLRWTCPVDGDIQGQPLYAANFAIGGGTHNVLFVTTEHDSIYAIDADSPSCVTYWHVSVLTAGARTATYTDLGGCNDVPEMGITGSPVMDPTTSTLYFVAETVENGTFYQRLHALNLTTGAEQSGSPVVIQASLTNNAGTAVTFNAEWQNQRPALALYGGGVFIGWASHCDVNTWWGWEMRYDASTLAQTTVFNVTPNGSAGGIWMSGGAPAFDSAGKMFLTTANGTFDDSSDTVPPVVPNNDFSMSFLNLNPATLLVQDYFTPTGEAVWSSRDFDVGSAGVTVLPDGAGPTAHPNLVVSADKQSHLWLVDRTDMGRFSTIMDSSVQSLTLPLASQCPGNCVFDSPGYYNGTVYIAPSSCPLMALPLTSGLFPTTAQSIAIPSSLSADIYNYPGPTPSITASPSGNAIVWVLDNSL
ncbi:MAG: PQQ-binding-like beta-propeller repeat protein, partial [Sinobacteraceae bacterium]|nr:PQQ-binding-like beta-propeller repeat protein [Nevskiaceae bacterium]